MDATWKRLAFKSATIGTGRRHPVRVFSGQVFVHRYIRHLFVALRVTAAQACFRTAISTNNPGPDNFIGYLQLLVFSDNSGRTDRIVIPILCRSASRSGAPRIVALLARHPCSETPLRFRLPATSRKSAANLSRRQPLAPVARQNRCLAAPSVQRLQVVFFSLATLAKYPFALHDSELLDEILLSSPAMKLTMGAKQRTVN